MSSGLVGLNQSNRIVISLFLGGFIVKTLSIPFVILSQAVFARLRLVEVLLFIIVVEMGYLSIGFDLIMASFSSLNFNVFFVLNITAAICTFWGGLAALQSRSVLAGLLYSSVQHAGAVLCMISMARNSEFATVGSVYYFVVYFITAGLCVALLRVLDSSTCLDSDAIRTAVLTILVALLLSLAGVPPFIGFYSKVFMVAVVVDSQAYFALFIQIISSLIAFVYYGRMLIMVWARVVCSYTGFARAISLFGISVVAIENSYILIIAGLAV
jgi:NADH-quinone oxidoreductase subunit N